MADPELVAQLVRGVGFWNDWRPRIDRERPRSDLARVDLEEASLAGADLKEADLVLANLRAANLRGADLRGADLRGAILEEADLSEANLAGADLRGAYLSKASMVGASLIGANLRQARVFGADLRGVDLREAILFKTKLNNSNLTAVRISEGGLANSILVQCRLSTESGVETVTRHVLNRVLEQAFIEPRPEEYSQGGVFQVGALTNMEYPAESGHVHAEGFTQIEIAAGTAPVEKIARLLNAFSELYELMGGSGLVYTRARTESFVGEGQEVT